MGWLRSRLAVVRQDPVLFAATIAENIRYGNPMIQHNDIEQAAIAAQAHKFILKVGGYNYYGKLTVDDFLCA